MKVLGYNERLALCLCDDDMGFTSSSYLIPVLMSIHKVRPDLIDLVGFSEARVSKAVFYFNLTPSAIHIAQEFRKYINMYRRK